MVANQIEELAPSGAQLAIIGSKHYYRGVKQLLEAKDNYTVATPLEHLGIGWQLNWLKKHTPQYEQLSLGLGLEENYALSS